VLISFNIKILNYALAVIPFLCSYLKILSTNNERKEFLKINL